jgi:hypothetical protein
MEMDGTRFKYAAKPAKATRVFCSSLPQREVFELPPCDGGKEGND